MVRCSHYPQSPHFLEACDELGLMVWQEPPGWGYVGDDAFQQIVLENVHDMVVLNRNRPSVIVWATRLNETGHYPRLYARTRRLAYELDGTRQTTGAVTFHSTTGWAEDLFSYDDYFSSAGHATLKPPVPGVPYLVSESVGAMDGAHRCEPGAAVYRSQVSPEVHPVILPMFFWDFGPGSPATWPSRPSPSTSRWTGADGPNCASTAT